LRRFEMGFIGLGLGLENHRKNRTIQFAVWEK
jgi:hypothetical protein